MDSRVPDRGETRSGFALKLKFSCLSLFLDTYLVLCFFKKLPQDLYKLRAPQNMDPSMLKSER